MISTVGVRGWTLLLVVLVGMSALSFGANVTFIETNIPASPSTTYHFRDFISSVEWIPGTASMKFLYFGILSGATIQATGVTCTVQGSCTFSGSLNDPEVAKEIILGTNYTTPPSGDSQILFKGGDGTSSFEYKLYFTLSSNAPSTSDAGMTRPERVTFYLIVVGVIGTLIYFACTDKR